jgi:hypothetical protein
MRHHGFVDTQILGVSGVSFTGATSTEALPWCVAKIYAQIGCCMIFLSLCHVRILMLMVVWILTDFCVSLSLTSKDDQTANNLNDGKAERVKSWIIG